MSCVYTINLKGKEMTFDNVYALNVFLSSGATTKYSINSVDAVKEVIAQKAKGVVFQSVDEDNQKVHKFKVNGVETESVTTKLKKLINDSTGEKLILPFNIDQWRANTFKKKFSELVPKLGDKAVDETNAFINLQLLKFSQTAEYGTVIHGVFEKILNAKEGKTQDEYIAFLESLDTNSPEISELKNIVENDDIIKNFVNEIKIYVNNMLKEHPGATFLTEVKVFDEESQTTGIIDLIVVDNKGTATIYDYKSSLKTPGEWNDQKKLGTAYQLGVYKNILKNYGIVVNDVKIVPIKMDMLDKINELSIEPTYVESLTSDIMSVVNSVVPLRIKEVVKEFTNVKVLETLKNLFNYEVNNAQLSDKNKAKFFSNIKINKDTGKEMIFSQVDNKYIVAAGIVFTEAEKDAIYSKHLDYIKDFPLRVRNFVLNSRAVKGKGQRAVRWGLIGEYTASDTTGRMTSILEKYILDDNWDFIEDPILSQMDIIIFRNRVTGVMDIMTMVNEQLNTPKPLTLGKLLTGNYKKDNNVIEILESTVANQELMKMAFVLLNNPDIFEDSKIGYIQVLNKNGNVVRTRLKPLFKAVANILRNVDKKDVKIDYQFNTLVKPNIEENLYETYITFLQNSTLPYVKNKANLFTNADNVQDKLDILLSQQAILEESYADKEELRNNPEYQLLNMAINYLSDFDGGLMQDLSQFGKIPMLSESSMASDPESLRNVAAKFVTGHFRKAQDQIRFIYNKYTEKRDKVLEDFFVSRGYRGWKSSLIGDASFANVYDNLFENKEKMILKWANPNDANDYDRSLTSEERKIIAFWIGLMDEINTEKMSPDLKDAYMANKELRASIPLVPATLTQLFKEGKFTEGIKNKWDRLISRSIDPEAPDVDSKSLLKKTNYFLRQRNDGEREKFLTEHTPERNLSLIFDMYMMNHYQTEEYNKILPLIEAVKTYIAVEESQLPVKFPNLKKFIDTFVENIAFNKISVEEGSEGAHKVTAVSTKFVSYLTVGLNIKLGIVQSLQNIYATITTLFANSPHGERFGLKDLLDASQIVMGTPENMIGDYNFVQKLNEVYGFSQMDVSQLRSNMSRDRAGVLNFNSRLLYWLNSAPDYFFRTNFFLAQAVKDGVLEVQGGKISKNSALRYDEKTNKLIYDEKKDKRFSLLFDGRSNKTTDAYKRQLALYKAIKQKMTEEGTLDENGNMTIPYTFEEKNTIKRLADEVFTSTDEINKTQLRNTIIGRLFSTLKTWLFTKRDQWYKENGLSNTRRQWKLVTDENNQPVLDENGEYMYLFEGIPQEGIFQTLMFMYNELRSEQTLNVVALYKNMDDYRKSNVHRMATDLALYGLLTALATVLFDDEDEFWYKVLVSSSTDLFVWNNVKAAVDPKSSFVPISYSLRVIDDIWGLSTGEKDFINVVNKNVGLARPIVYMINQ